VCSMVCPMGPNPATERRTFCTYYWAEGNQLEDNQDS
jgi:hypothetical protein